MKFIKDTTWEKVFEEWKNSEKNNSGWVHHATKVKGWPDWESWRKFSASQINANKLDWQIFTFTDPLNEIPEMLIGAYSGWQSRLPKKNVYTFADLLDIPEQYNFFSQHKGVLSIIHGLPFVTEFIGIIRDDLNKPRTTFLGTKKVVRGKTVCLEGHHRAVAIALAKKQGKQINFKDNIKIALAHLPKDKVYLLDEMLKRGSSKK